MADLYTIRKTEAKERITTIKLEKKCKTSKSAFLKIYIWNKQKRATLVCFSELGCLFQMQSLGGEEPRWRRSRTGRTLSPPQIHQKSI